MKLSYYPFVGLVGLIRPCIEVDQPMLNPSVEKFYDRLGFHSGLAGLPQLVYHIEEERLSILEARMGPGPQA